MSTQSTAERKHSASTGHPHEVTPSPDRPPRPPRAPRALVVDDAATVRLYHREVLRRAGFLVDEAANGYEALEHAVTTDFDLMLVDVNMPHMDGFTLVRALRADGVHVVCPIVTISTESRNADAEEALRAGANLYLLKPVNSERLAVIAGAVAAYQAQRAPL